MLMKRHKIALGLSVMTSFWIGLPFFSSADTSTAPLWQKAVTIIAQNETWVPGLITSRSEELGKKDDVKHVEESQVKLSLGPDQTIAEEIIAYSKDGKAVTPPTQSENTEEEDSEDTSVGMGAEFWNPELQDQVTVTVRDERKTIQGKTCVAHDFMHRMDQKNRVKGTAWLDETTGAPVEVEFQPDPLPKHVDAMKSLLRYYSGSDGVCYLQEMLMEGAGGFLMIKQKFRVTVTMSDYWQAPAEVIAALKAKSS